MSHQAHPCTCPVYKFPHRPGGGRCGSTKFSHYCANCGEGCEPVVADFGIGAYEYWGSKGHDRRLEVVSPCCDAPCVDYETGETAKLSRDRDEGGW